MKTITLFFDTETTGIRKNGFIPRVVQIGALLADEDGRTLGELNVLLQPSGFSYIPKVASDVHGFTYDDIDAFGIDRSTGLDAFFQLMSTADIIAAHNIEYDLDLLQIEIQYQKEQSNGLVAAWQEELDRVQKFCTMANTKELLKLPLTDKQITYFQSIGRSTDEYKNPHLQESFKHFFGREFEGAHDAMADVRACRDVYFELHKLKA